MRSIALLTAAVLVFAVVSVDFQLKGGQIEDVPMIMSPGHGRTIYEDTSAHMVVPVVTHLYPYYADSLLVFGFVFLVLLIYIKTRFL